MKAPPDAYEQCGPKTSLTSLIATYKLTDVEPYRYLADTLTRIVDGHPHNRLDDLLAWAYAAAPALKAVA
ncbi:transposase domain-containing protein [Reyranella massiliensis]|uniref:transposase domain-containing protein n=1 Tax=Reyranella massiliensis TaxID=445220 RepID=UPI00030E7176|nr:transposase domain-containing protein [Reyranella massiliensis]